MNFEYDSTDVRPVRDVTDDVRSQPTRQYLTTKEAAEYLGYASDRTLRNLRLRGSGPEAYKLPSGAVRYTQEALDSWARSKRSPGEVLSAWHLSERLAKAERRKERDRERKARQRAHREM